MSAEDPQERPDYIINIINSLERYNPEAVKTLEAYLQQQCENRYVDCNANRTLLKLYQLNPDKLKDEVITNILVLALTCFPSPQFSLSLHLIPPSLSTPSPNSRAELPEAISKLRELNNQLQSAQYANFWATLDSDDLYADLVTDIDGFEEMIRTKIVGLVGQAFREVDLSLLESWLGLEGKTEAVNSLVAEAGWTIEDGVCKVPKNPENEARKTEVREDVGVEQFARIIRRSWEETV